MLTRLKFSTQLKQIGQVYLRKCSDLTTTKNHCRVVESENHAENQYNGGEHFKYKTQQHTENLLSEQKFTDEQTSSTIEKIQIISSDFVKNQLETMSEVSRDVMGQWPMKSESELAGQGQSRLKNAHFNKVSSTKFSKIIGNCV
jgi:hypothetical protein